MRFGPGATSIQLPALGLLGTGTYELQVGTFGSPDVPYTELNRLPAAFREGTAALSYISVGAAVVASTP